MLDPERILSGSIVSRNKYPVQEWVFIGILAG
jgi:hypothetical protein